MGQALKLVNFAKVFPLCLLSSLTFFSFMYFLTKEISSESEQLVFTTITVVSVLAFFVFFALQNKMISAQMIADLEDEEPPSFGDIKEGFKKYFLSTVGVLIVFAIMYKIVLPLVGNVAGEIFQISIFDFDFNLLTLIINLACITWMLLALAEITTIEASFIQTISFTFGFVFSNFSKVVGFVIAVMASWFIFSFAVVSTATGDQMIMMPLKVLLLAYLFGFINSLATNLFINNITEDDLADDEEE